MSRKRRRQSAMVWLFPRSSDHWITVLRVGLGLQVLAYAFSLRADWNYLLAGGHAGLINRDLSETILATEGAVVPTLGWVVHAGKPVGFSENAILTMAWIALILAGLLLLTGFRCRLAGVFAWLLQVMAAKSGSLLAYGVDAFTTIGLFYLVMAPLPDRWSLDFRFRKGMRADPRLGGFVRRVLQIHLCLIYFFGGVSKCLGAGWWNGENLWRALIRPPFNILNPDLIVHFKFLLPAGGVFICLLELGYPVFIWFGGTRRIWLVATCLMHLLIGVTMGMVLFASIMILLNLAAFGSDLIFVQSASLFRRGKKAPESGAVQAA